MKPYVFVLAMVLAGCGAADTIGTPPRDRLAEIVVPPERVLAAAPALGADAEQLAAMRADADAARGAVAPLEVRLVDARRRLELALDRHPIDEDAAIEATADVAQVEAEIKVVRMRLLVRLRNRLTADQLARL